MNKKGKNLERKTKKKEKKRPFKSVSVCEIVSSLTTGKEISPYEMLFCVMAHPSLLTNHNCTDSRSFTLPQGIPFRVSLSHGFTFYLHMHISLLIFHFVYTNLYSNFTDSSRKNRYVHLHLFV